MDIWEKWRGDKERRKKKHEREFRYTERRRPPILTLRRKWFTDKTTIGELCLDNEFLCHTLEDSIRDPNKDGILQAAEKIHGVTAIPAGTYEVVFTHYIAGKAKVPFLLGVKHFNRIYIHWGNFGKDSLGCILCGVYDPVQPDFVGNSRATFKVLMEKLDKEMNHRRLYIDIEGGPTA